MIRHQWTKVLLITFLSSGLLTGCDKIKNFFKKSPSTIQDSSTVQQDQGEFKAPEYKDITIPEVIKTELGEGQGTEVKSGDFVSIHYTGWIYDPAKPENKGPQYAGTNTSESPLKFELGKGELPKGFEDGIIGMKPGGKRRLIIPKELAYGDKGTDKVPPGSILMVEVTLMP